MSGFKKNKESSEKVKKQSNIISKTEIINKAFELHSQGDTKEASKYYELFLKNKFNDPNVFSNYGIICKENGQLNKAINLYKKAIEIEPKNSDFHSNLGNAYKENREINQAKLEFEKAIKYNNNSDTAHYNLGTVFVELKEYSKAAKYFNNAITINPSLIQAYLNLGSILKEQKQYHEAIKVNEKLIKLKPSMEEAYYNMGNLLNLIGENKKAESALKKAIKINPNFTKAYSNLSNILLKQGHLIEAEKNIRKSIELNPKNPNLYYSLGNILLKKGSLKKAKFSVLKAIDLKSDLHQAYNTLCIILKNLGELKEAEMFGRKATSMDPNNGIYLNSLGVALINQGKNNEAEVIFKKALLKDRKLIDIPWNLHSLSNDIYEAERWVKECLKIDKNNNKAKITLSGIQLHLGNKELFNQLLQTNLESDPRLRSIKWISKLTESPKLFFNRWVLFDYFIQKSQKNRPFYEFGVWHGTSFNYLLKHFKKGYGFDTFNGLPTAWGSEKKGSYSAEGHIPNIDGGVFIEGEFAEVLPSFFSKPREKASIINFDADLYSSTICALENSKSIIDEKTILIFDEFLINENWENDEHKAMIDFCHNNNMNFEVLGISYFSKQVAVKLVDMNIKESNN